MIKRISAVITVLFVILSMTGCDDGKRIDKAAIAETVIAFEDNGQIFYAFYMLENENPPKGVIIQADSFEKACALAREEYIPNLSLAKLHLFIVQDKLCDLLLYQDINNMSCNYIVSPNTVVAACDENIMEFIAKSDDAFVKIEDYIILNKKNSEGIKVNILSILNNFNSSDIKEFDISYINSKSELKIKKYTIFQ